MRVKTGLRAGVTPQDILQGLGDTAAAAAQSVGDAVQNLDNATQDAARSARRWLDRSGVTDTLNKAFWFPLEPPR